MPDVRDRMAAVSALTDRQKEILRLIAQHYERKEIARHLGITEHTVKAHITKARQRLGVGTEKQATRLLAEYEKNSGITPNGQYPTQTIAVAAITPDAAGHEQTLSPPEAIRPNPDHKLRGVEEHLVAYGRAEQGSIRRRDDTGLENFGTDHEFRKSGLHSGHGDGLVDGRKRLFRWRLDELSLLQSIVLLLGLTVGLGFGAVALLATSAATFQGLENIFGYP